MSTIKNKENQEVKFHFPEIELISTLYTPEQLTPPHGIQVALAGRSNVGKSSLLNALGRRKNLAKVSSTPGKTRSVNFFNVKKYDFFLVDLPGYGYAKRSKSERDVWAELISQYLAETENLKLLLILIDVRIPPQELDKKMLAFATQVGLKTLPILTKCDKVKQKDLAQAQNFWKNLSGTMPMPISAHTNYGVEKLWKRLIETVEIHRDDDDILNPVSANDDDFFDENQNTENNFSDFIDDTTN